MDFVIGLIPLDTTTQYLNVIETTVQGGARSTSEKIAWI